MKVYKGEGFHVKGIEDVIRGLNEANADVIKASEQAIWEAGSMLSRELKRELSHPGTGRAYYRGKSGGRRGPYKGTGSRKDRYKYYTASEPGRPPAPGPSGRLRSSITHNTSYRNASGSGEDKLPWPGGTIDEIKGYVGTNVEYGYYLEVGAMIWPYGNMSIGKRRLLPRPWFRKTINSNSNKVVKLMEKSLKRAFMLHTGKVFTK